MENTDIDILSKTLFTLVSSIKNKGAMTDEQIVAAVSLACSTHMIPCEVLSDRKLGPLESVVKHLKEKHGLSYHEIAVMLHRDDRTIWCSYKNACRKVASA